MTYTQELLKTLSQEWGYSWSQIGQIMGVSVSTIRVWKNTESGTKRIEERLRHLAYFSKYLHKLGHSPASWMSTPLLEGYVVCPIHLYNLSGAEVLIDLADGSLKAEEALDLVMPNWREQYSDNGFSVVRFDDGSYGTIRKDM